MPVSELRQVELLNKLGGRHAHSPQHVSRFPSGKVIETCDCGATREGDAHSIVKAKWHTCPRCTHPYGLP